jgi:hypothetical protein
VPILTEDVISLAATPTGIPTIATRTMMIVMTIRTIIIGTAA